MSMDTFTVYVGVYDSINNAESDFRTVNDLHHDRKLLERYDAAVIVNKGHGKVKVVKTHETQTREGGLLGAGVGLATGLVVALFPMASLGAASLGAATLLEGTATFSMLGAIAGHAVAGLSRRDLKELGETLDAGEAGLVVVGVAADDTPIESSLLRARRVKKCQLAVDPESAVTDAAAVSDN